MTGKELKKFLADNGITDVYKFAPRLGVTHATIYNWYKMEKVPLVSEYAIRWVVSQNENH